MAGELLGETRAPARRAGGAPRVLAGLTLACAIGVAGVVARPRAALAQDEPPAPRAVPDYDGRGEPGPSAGDVLLWVPRVLLSPLYLVSEYVIRRPLGFVVAEAERADLPAILVDFFTFGPDRQAGLVPTALFDFGLRPSVGLYAYGDDFLVDGNDLRAYAAWGGERWLAASLTDRIHLVEGISRLSISGGLDRRPDYLFHGLGSDSRDEDLSRYEARRATAQVEFESALWRASSVSVGIRAQDVRYDDRGCCGDASLRRRVEQGRLEEPPGFDGYAPYTTYGAAALDTRRERPAAGDGVRVELELAHGFDLKDPARRRWLRYGGTVGAYWDVSGTNRTLSLSLTALFADPLGEGEVPFGEQVTLGGTRLMRGFLEGRLVGRSAAVATFEYRWPIWIWVDGAFHVAVGNVFDEHLSGLRPGNLRLSTGLGIRSGLSRDHSLDLMVGVGTEPFDSFGAGALRLVVGARRGF